MKKLPKALLAVSVVSFVVGFFVTLTPVALPPAWMVAMPVGAISLGLFLIAFVLENETAKFDAEVAVAVERCSRQTREAAPADHADPRLHPSPAR